MRAPPNPVASLLGGAATIPHVPERREVGTVVPTYLQCRFPRFRLPTVNLSLNTLNGKFQKQTSHTFSTVRCSEYGDEILRHPAWHMNRPAAHRILALMLPAR